MNYDRKTFIVLATDGLPMLLTFASHDLANAGCGGCQKSTYIFVSKITIIFSYNFIAMNRLKADLGNSSIFYCLLI